MLRLRLLSASLLLLGPWAMAQDRAALAGAADALAAHADLQGGRVGLWVADAGSGEVLLQKDAGQGFMTASNMKLIAAAVALETLGPDFVFETRIETAGAIAGGVLDGDLLLLGSGDPTLGGGGLADPLAVFQGACAQLKAHGITRIKGRVVGIDDVQADEALGWGWQWDYLHEDYAAAFGGLNFADNIVRIEVTPVAVGERPRFTIVPQCGFVLVQPQIECVAGGGRTRLTVARTPGTNTIRIGGTIAADAGPQEVKASVENPTRYAAAALRTALLQAGIQVTGPAVDRDEAGGPFPDSTRVLATLRSRSLQEMLRPTLKDSVNLYAEQLARTASRTVLGRSDSKAMAEHAQNLLAALGVECKGMVLADGSGLSRRNLVQPQQLGALLLGMHRSPQRDVFVQALPIAGQDGTLKRRFPEGHPARGRVSAKTGYIGNVVCLSGYVRRQAADAPPVVFVTMLNQFTCESDAAKAACDAWVAALVRAIDS